MRYLDIPNNNFFNQITSIKIEKRQKNDEWSHELEQFEDDEGDIYSEKRLYLSMVHWDRRGCRGRFDHMSRYYLISKTYIDDQPHIIPRYMARDYHLKSKEKKKNLKKRKSLKKRFLKKRKSLKKRNLKERENLKKNKNLKVKHNVIF
ncbi:hypothetical protein Ddye_014092 [Dipteronia dyeriana]|uniref:Uncharacterized protein n=1 Tax=Dipteronia dyeriana TaxID=168575 RepID=A0AAE0CKA4_9ROSI|nr:hypothetical protein Ddye_014092 [Dipteronia dyeriana]